MLRAEKVPTINTYVARPLEVTPKIHDTMVLITQEIKALGGGELFRPREDPGVAVFWWGSFASINRGKDTTRMQRILSDELPPSAGRSIHAELGEAKLYPNMSKIHIAYQVHSEYLNDENEALHEAGEALGFRVPAAGRFHLSIGSFALRHLNKYRREDPGDIGPHIHAARVANRYRDRFPAVISLNKVSIAHNFE